MANKPGGPGGESPANFDGIRGLLPGDFPGKGIADYPKLHPVHLPRVPGPKTAAATMISQKPLFTV